MLEIWLVKLTSFCRQTKNKLFTKLRATLTFKKLSENWHSVSLYTPFKQYLLAPAPYKANLSSGLCAFLKFLKWEQNALPSAMRVLLIHLHHSSFKFIA